MYNRNVAQFSSSAFWQCFHLRCSHFSWFNFICKASYVLVYYDCLGFYISNLFTKLVIFCSDCSMRCFPVLRALSFMTFSCNSGSNPMSLFSSTYVFVSGSSSFPARSSSFLMYPIQSQIIEARYTCIVRTRYAVKTRFE